MTQNWDERALDWDRDERVRFYADQALSSLTEHVDVRDGEWKAKRVLDFGCGTGLLAEKLAPLVGAVVAVDTSPAMIEVLRGKEISNVSAICADLDDPAVRSSAPWFGGFDLIVASSVCGFLPDYEATLEALSQALNDTGYFAQSDWLASDNEPGMSVDRISNTFDLAGLERVHVDTAYSVTFDGEEMPVVMGVARRKL